MRPRHDILSDNLDRLKHRIARAALSSGRSAEQVRLVAVTKTVALETARQLFDLGVTDLGENRPQELWSKQATIDRPVHWHLVGTLQRNKTRRTLPLVDLIHSVDSIELLRRLDELGVELDLHPRVLLQVNVSQEPTKHGFRVTEVPEVIEATAALARVEVDGLMTMAPYDQPPDCVSRVFAELRRLRDHWASRTPPQCPLTELSMGMSGDFELAIAEGATIIRVGSALFEGLEVGV